MKELQKHIYDEKNGLHYTLVGDYYIPDLVLEEDLDNYSIERWGRMHREYLKEYKPMVYNELILSGRLHSYLADLNEQATERLEILIEQMKAAEGVTEILKSTRQMEWVGRMNSIRNRAEEIIYSELIYC